MSKLSELIDDKIEQMYDDEKTKEEAIRYCYDLLTELVIDGYREDLEFSVLKQIDFYYPLTEEEINDKIADNKYEEGKYNG